MNKDAKRNKPNQDTIASDLLLMTVVYQKNLPRTIPDLEQGSIKQ